MSQSFTSVTEVIDALVDAYNAHDAQAFAALFSEDAIAYEYPNSESQIGRDGIFAYYQQRFAQYPTRMTRVVHRAILGNRVVDHEEISTPTDGVVFETIAIYDVREQFIQRIELVRALA